MRYEYDVSIASRLLPSDTTVEVPLPAGGFVGGDVNPEREIEQSTTIAAAVATPPKAAPPRAARPSERVSQSHAPDDAEGILV